MIARSCEMARIAVPRKVLVRNRYEAEVHAAELQRRQVHADVAELDAEGKRRHRLQEEQHSAGDQQLVDRLGGEHRSDDELVQQRAERSDHQDRGQHRQPQRPAEHVVRVEHRVHADHHQLGVTDPHHVDDAEDQVQAEREQREHAPEQQSVDDRLEKEDVEEFHRASAPTGPGKPS
jgi:hypothetical protein